MPLGLSSQILNQTYGPNSSSSWSQEQTAIGMDLTDVIEWVQSTKSISLKKAVKMCDTIMHIFWTVG
jgi:hypothetical protein